jgi:stage II sporulation protein AA (anti-sigma F factor antagonist)
MARWPARRDGVHERSPRRRRGVPPDRRRDVTSCAHETGRSAAVDDAGGAGLQAPLTLEVQRAEGMTLVTAAGEIDLSTRDRLRDCLGRLDGPVAIDLAEVSYIDSSGIGVIIAAHSRLTERAGGLFLRNVNAPITNILTIVGLDGLIGN